VWNASLPSEFGTIRERFRTELSQIRDLNSSLNCIGSDRIGDIHESRWTE